MKSNKPVQAQTLSYVAEAFARWRASRTRREPTPQVLRDQAVALLDQHVASHVCQALRINGAMLKQWHAQQGTEQRSATRAKLEPVQPTSLFVELPVIQPVSRSPEQVLPSTRSTLNVQWPNGTRLSVATELTTHELLVMLQSLPTPSPSLGESA